MNKDQVTKTLEELHLEHQKIKSQMELFLTVINDKNKGISQLNPDDLIKFIQFTREHHQHEEKELFPWLAKQTFLNHGGPRCIHFMGLRTLQEIKGVDYWSMKSGRPRPSWLPQSSPLEIPMEEHFHGEVLGKELLTDLDNLKKQGKPLDPYKVIDFLNFVEQHRAKEDECLFVMIAHQLMKDENSVLTERISNSDV